MCTVSTATFGRGYGIHSWSLTVILIPCDVRAFAILSDRVKYGISGKPLFARSGCREDHGLVSITGRHTAVPSDGIRKIKRPKMKS